MSEIMSNGSKEFFSSYSWLNIEEVMGKNVMSPYKIFSLYTENTFDMSKNSNITLYTVTIKTVMSSFDPLDIISHIALILCIDYLFNVHITDKVTMSGLLTI